MNPYRSNDLNHFWLYFVLIHVMGSFIGLVILNLSYGIIILNSLLWMYYGWENRRKKIGYVTSALGWSLSLYCLIHMPAAHSAVLLMNMFILAYVIYYHYGSLSLLQKRNHLKPINGKEFVMILLLTLLIFIAAAYVNAVSMLVFKEYVSTVLSEGSSSVWSGILVYALAPAFVEELVFRGIIFQRLGNGKKAILLSAILFALGHMNFNQMSYAFVVGLFFAMIYSRTENLTVTICVHFLFNAYSVVSSLYENSMIIRAINGVSIGGYHLLSPSATVGGSPSLPLILTGSVIFFMASGLVGALLRFYRRKEDSVELIGKEDQWKPGISFLLASAICVLTAILIEVMAFE